MGPHDLATPNPLCDVTFRCAKVGDDAVEKLTWPTGSLETPPADLPVTLRGALETMRVKETARFTVVDKQKATTAEYEATERRDLARWS